jgi:hypothetical protein
MRTVDGKYQKLRFALRIAPFVAHIDTGVRDHAIPRLAERIIECNQTRFALWKIPGGSQWNPNRLLWFWRKQVTQDWNPSDDRRKRTGDER